MSAAHRHERAATAAPRPPPPPPRKPWRRSRPRSHPDGDGAVDARALDGQRGRAVRGAEHLRHGQPVQLRHRQCAEQRRNRHPAPRIPAHLTAGILDYAPIPNAYTELTSFQIANEGATTRSAATPIFYNLKITQDGLLSFSYSVSGGAYSYLIKNQSITASNGPLPASFRVGFAGSDGGATNIHEIMCFKAASANQSGSSASVNQKASLQGRGGHSGLLRLLQSERLDGHGDGE